MIHIDDIRCAQLLLIEVGALMQLAALGALMKESPKSGCAVPGVTEVPPADDEEEEMIKLPEAPKPAKPVEYHRELRGLMEDVPKDVRPGDLLKTAKVSFKQTLQPNKKRAHAMIG